MISSLVIYVSLWVMYLDGWLVYLDVFILITSCVNRLRLIFFRGGRWMNLLSFDWVWLRQ